MLVINFNVYINTFYKIKNEYSVKVGLKDNSGNKRQCLLRQFVSSGTFVCWIRKQRDDKLIVLYVIWTLFHLKFIETIRTLRNRKTKTVIFFFLKSNLVSIAYWTIVRLIEFVISYKLYVQTKAIDWTHYVEYIVV